MGVGGGLALALVVLPEGRTPMCFASAARCNAPASTTQSSCLHWPLKHLTDALTSAPTPPALTLSRPLVLQGSAGVLELGASTLAMFSSRAGGAVAFAEAFAVPVLVKLLSPLYAPVVVVNIANAIGNLAGAQQGLQ